MTEETLPMTLRLKSGAPAARALGLRGGDVVLAVNGRVFNGDAAALERLIAAFGKETALTVQRGMAGEVTVLTGTARLGKWEEVPAPVADPTRRRFDPMFLRNWEVMRAADGSYDLYPLRLRLTALLVPQLWLMQMRLWLPCAMLMAAVVAGLIVHPALALVVQAAGAAHLRWTHAIYLRLDRQSRGLSFHMVLAARTEAAAHAAYRAVQPDDRSLFSPPPAQRGAVAGEA